MNFALEMMEKMRTNKETIDRTHIEDELSMLQDAINQIESQMQIVQEESMSYKRELQLKQQAYSELENEHQILICRLKTTEDESLFLRKRLEIVNKEFNISSMYEKDEQIRKLESDLRRLLENGNAGLNYDRNVSREREQENLVSTLIDDNNKYLELIQYKDRTIDELRKDMDALANALEKRLMQQQVESSEDGGHQTGDDEQNDVEEEQEEEGEEEDEDEEGEEEEGIEETDADPENATIGADISHELVTIKQMLGVSHSDITEKVLVLHKDLNKMKDENHSLRKYLRHSNPSQFEQSEHLQKHNEDLQTENTTLRDMLNKPYPGIVENILNQGKEIKDLKEENKLLRLAVANNKKGLIDSNLRKRERIKELEQRIGEVQGQSDRSSQRRPSDSQGSYDPFKQTKSQTSQEKAAGSKVKNKGDPVSSPRESSPRDTNPPGEKFLDAMMKQNEMIGRLQADNDKLRSRLAAAKETKNLLENEVDRLQQKEKANDALENELMSLRTALKEMSEDADLTACKRKIDELQNEVQRLKQNNEDSLDETTEDGVTPAGSPNRSRLSLSAFKGPGGVARVKKLLSENSQLRSDLEKAHQDLNRLAKIAERSKHNSSADQAQRNKMKKLENKVQRLEDENFALKDNMQDLQRTNNDAESELMYLKTEVENLNVDKAQAHEEIQNLRSFIKDWHDKKTEEGGLTEMVSVLNETVDELQKQKDVVEDKLARAEAEKVKLEKESSSLKANNKMSTDKRIRQLEKEKEELEQKLSNATLDLTSAQEQNKELEEISHKLAEELEKVRNDISETHFADWLSQDVDRRLALLTPESHRSDINMADAESKQIKKDQARVIRKLQIENQMLRAKLVSLEDEAAGTTKIIADMERGHGHLTGTLRCHLILQKAETGKLLEGSLQQYSGDFEILKRNFRSLEEKYDKENNFSKRRDHAWDLFANACATMDNIQTILNEGLVKVEEDIEKELTDQEFEDKDYKSRLWILRRRLSDVENRHRELQLRAEELNLRLDAKTTEYEVTQDELEDTTRDLETRETSLQSLKNELRKLSNENAKLKALISSLRENQDKTVGAVLNENEALQKAANNRDNKLKTYESDVEDMMAKLDEKDAALNVMKKMRENAEKEIEALKNRIQILERKLKDMTAQRDKLKKEAENRAGYMGNCHDDHGTIHMLRDDIKRISKENAHLKQDILLKQRQMYDMSKDLHKMKMHRDLNSSFSKDKKLSLKDEVGVKMIHGLAELKAQKFLLETKLEDIERRNEEKTQEEFVDQFVENAFKSKLIEKEREIERLKREKATGRTSKSPNTTRDDTMSDISPSVFDSYSDRKSIRDLKRQMNKLRVDNELLRDVVEQKKLGNLVDSEKKQRENARLVDQQKAEVESLSTEVESKQKKIKELLKTIEEMQDGKIGKLSKDRVTNLIEKTKEEEIKALTKKLNKKDKEMEELKRKSDENEKELQRIKETQSALSNDDDKFQNLYLNRMTPTRSGNTPTDGYLDKMSPKTAVNQYNKSSTLATTPQSQRNTDSGFAMTPKNNAKSEQPKYTSTDLINLDEPFYEELMPYEVMIPESPKEKKKGSADAVKKTQIPTRIPVTPNKRKRMPEPTDQKQDGGGYEVPINVKITSKDGKKTTAAAKKKTPQVKPHEIFIQDELKILRQNVGLTEHDTLQTLGRDAFHSLIDYQIYSRNSDDIAQLQDDIDDLRNENETLQNKLQKMTLPDQQQELRIGNVEERDANTSNQVLKEKLELNIDENETLKDLLETQSQNVKSQEAVIRTLKKDITDNKARLEKYKDAATKEMKEKKSGNRELKKQIKENGKNTQKDKTKLKLNLKQVKEKLHAEEKKVKTQEKVIEDLESQLHSLRHKIDTNLDYSNQEINALNNSLTSEGLMLEKLHSENTHFKKLLDEKEKEVNKLKENLETKEATYEKVLKNAESALVEAKSKLTHQNDRNEELKKIVEEISNERANEKNVFDEVKEELKKALVKKNEIIENFGTELEGLRNSSKESEENLKEEIAKLETQCKEYETILEESGSTTSELNLTKNENSTLRDEIKLKQQELEIFRQQHELTGTNEDEISSLKKELSQTKSSLEELKRQHEKQQHKLQDLQNQNDVLTHTNDLLSEEKSTLVESSLQTDPIDDTDGFEGNMELEIEMEILRGCNEELEKEVEELQDKIKVFEEDNEVREKEVKQVQDDLGRTLEYLRELSEENEFLKNTKAEFQAKVTSLEHENVDLKDKILTLEKDNKFKGEDEMQKLKDELRNAKATIDKNCNIIEEMESVMDQLEEELKARDKIIDEDKIAHDKSIKELESVVNDLEEEIQSNATEHEQSQVYNKKAREILEMSFKAYQQQQSEEVFKLNNNINDLTNKLDWCQYENKVKSKENKTLKIAIDEWIKKSASQTEEMNRLQDQLISQSEANQNRNEHLFFNQNNDKYVLSNQIDILKTEIENKNSLVKNLQIELQDKEEQYSKVLSALNRRRDESKTFISMQDKMQNELDSKEDLIRKLMFKLKSNSLDVTDTSLNLSDNSIEDIESDIELGEDFALQDKNVNKVDDNHARALKSLSELLSSTRKRNHRLNTDLENCRKNVLQAGKEKSQAENKCELLEVELDEVRKKLKELRTLMQESPDVSFGDENKAVAMKAKLYSAYKELREKSIEIATLRMSMEIKDLEIESLEKEIRQQNTKDSLVDHKGQLEHKSECTHSNDIKSLVQELEEREENERVLQNQLTELRNGLMSKTKHCDYLQNEIVNVVGRFKDVEKRLSEQDKSLKERFLYTNEENSDLSEITPLTTNSFSTLVLEETITPSIVGINEHGNQTYLLDEQEEDDNNGKQNKQNKIKKLEELSLKQQEENLYFKAQINGLESKMKTLSGEKKDLDRENKNLKEEHEIKIEELMHEILKLEDELAMKEDEIKNLRQDSFDMTTSDNANGTFN